MRLDVQHASQAAGGCIGTLYGSWWSSWSDLQNVTSTFFGVSDGVCQVASVERGCVGLEAEGQQGGRLSRLNF